MTLFFFYCNPSMTWLHIKHFDAYLFFKSYIAAGPQVYTNIVSEYDQVIPQSQTADKPVVSWGRATQQSRDTRKTSKATSSLFPIAYAQTRQSLSCLITQSMISDTAHAQIMNGYLLMRQYHQFCWYYILQFRKWIIKMLPLILPCLKRSFFWNQFPVTSCRRKLNPNKIP